MLVYVKLGGLVGTDTVCTNLSSHQPNYMLFLTEVTFIKLKCDLTSEKQFHL